MPMRVLDADATGAKAIVGAKTVQEKRWRQAQVPPFPEPIAVTAKKRGWLEHEVDAWIEQRASLRVSGPTSPGKPGVRQFWADVAAGKRPHPRTVGKLRRLAAEAAVTWAVRGSDARDAGIGGAFASEDEARRYADDLRSRGYGNVVVERQERIR